MARTQNRLSARAAATVAKPGRHSDGNGLYLVVDRSGARRWIFMFRWGGKLKELGLGGLSAVSLAKARDAAADARRLVKADTNPIQARRAARPLKHRQRSLATSPIFCWRASHPASETRSMQRSGRARFKRTPPRCAKSRSQQLGPTISSKCFNRFGSANPRRRRGSAAVSNVSLMPRAPRACARERTRRGGVGTLINCCLGGRRSNGSITRPCRLRRSGAS
ncbi:MAG: Arm DNA-binding domain-containing protein [Methylovirgula sp.]